MNLKPLEGRNLPHYDFGPIALHRVVCSLPQYPALAAHTWSTKEAGIPDVRSCLTHTVVRCMENVSKTMTKPIYLSCLNEWWKQWVPPLAFKTIKWRKNPPTPQTPPAHQG